MKWLYLILALFSLVVGLLPIPNAPYTSVVATFILGAWTVIFFQIFIRKLRS